MSSLANLSLADHGQLLHLAQQSLCIRRPHDLLAWLQDDVQELLPHAVMLTAWGNFSATDYRYDIATHLPGLRLSAFDDTALRSFITALHQRWQRTGYAPYSLHAQTGFAAAAGERPETRALMQNMRCALIHGIRDQRHQQDSLYFVIGPAALRKSRSKAAFRFLLPYIDISFRQTAHLAGAVTQDKDAQERRPRFVQPARRSTLSPRENEILEWVCQGKTNQEIGLILHISQFTVKNHLQSIFRKLHVANRAQAVVAATRPSL